MAYIVSTTQTATASAASYTVTLGAHVSGDLLLVCLSQDGGGTAIAPDATSATAGWAMIGTQAASGAARQAWAYLIADSASEVNPVFTGATDDWIGTCLVVRDAHATAPFGATPTSGTDFVRTDWNSVNSSASGALTTAVDECLLLYSWCSDGSFAWMRSTVDACMSVDWHTTATISHIIGYRQQQSAAAAPSVTMYSQVATEGGNGWILAIRNKASGRLAPDLRITGSQIKFYGSFQTQHDSITWDAASAFAASIVTPSAGTISTSSTAPAVSVSYQPTYTTLGFASNIVCTDSTSSLFVGGSHAISSTDMTDKVFALTFGCDRAALSSLMGSEGMLVGFSDGTNIAIYQIATKTNGWETGAAHEAFIALGNATEYATSGAINWGAITRVAYLWHRSGSAATTVGMFVKNAFLIDSANFTGGNSAFPITFTDLYKLANSWDARNWARLNASSQVISNFPLTLGDGTNQTYFDGAAQSFEFPQAYSLALVDNWQLRWNFDPMAASLAIKASASDTIKLAAGVAATDTLQALTVDAASSTSATYDFGQSFVGWSPTWKTGVTCANATFSACAPVAFKGANVTSCIIKNTLATASEAAITFDANGATVTTSTIDITGTAAGYHLSLGASVTAITLNGVTLSGAAGTDKIYSALASGTLTITTDGTGTALVAGDVTFIGGSTATAVIAAPQVYQSVVISGFTAGSRIQIYDTTSATELFNGTASAGDTVISGSTATWTDPTAAAADRAIRVRVAYVNGTSAEQWQQFTGLTCGQTGATAEITYPVTPIDDDTYNANAIDGPAIYATSGITFTDAATDLVNISIAGGAVTWQTIYACFVYWLFTAAGIDDDVAYIDAPDPANYLLTSMKLKNTHANPLTVTGGYGRSATTGLVADIIDTAGSTGNIFPSPDHVVAYATGSGALTAGDITNIWAAATRTLSATQDANIVQVAGITVDGTGTDGDPWGPA